MGDGSVRGILGVQERLRGVVVLRADVDFDPKPR